MLGALKLPVPTEQHEATVNNLSPTHQQYHQKQWFGTGTVPKIA